MSLLELHAVQKAYGAATVLRDVDLQVAAGSRTAIVGPSGSGKTTLLRVIAGFEAPDAGLVTLGGRLLANGHDMVPAHRRGIGFVPQDGALFPHLSVAENVGFGLPRHTPRRARRIAELIDMVALEPSMLRRWPHEISGGQQQRVALARALAQQPQLMLLDEPFSALDTGLRTSTRKAVAQLLGQAGITTVLVTHDQSEALSFADQVVVMRSGQLVQAGAPLDLYRRPRDAAVASLLGEAIVLPAHVDNGWADCVLGRIAVNDSRYSGAARIMLRPEQLQIIEVPAEAAAEAACYGTVTATDFGGSICMLSVRLLRASECDPASSDDAAAQGMLQVRSTGLHVPAVGAMVRIAVGGQAHLLVA